MQVTPLPPIPLPPGATPQDAAAKVLPQIQAQAQAAAPLLQRAVDPTKKQERSHKNRSNGDRAKSGKGGEGGKDGRGGSVNIRV